MMDEPAHETQSQMIATKSFLVDCGAGQNIVQKEILHDLTPENKIATGIGEGQAIIAHRGTLKLITENSSVYSAPAYVSEDVTLNIFSTSMFTRNEDEKETTTNGIRVFTYKDELLGRSFLASDDHHYADLRVVLPTINILSVWHNRLAHFGRDKLIKLSRHLPQIVPPPMNYQCDECARNIVPRSAHITRQKTNEVLNMLHMDTTGRLEESLNGYTSLLVVKDEASSYTIVSPLHDKTEVYAKIKEIITWAERQTDKKVKYIVHDNGTEFTNNNMLNLCLDQQSKAISL